MTWEWHCNYTFPASFTFISVALINVSAVLVQGFKEMAALKESAVSERVERSALCYCTT